MKLLNLSHNAVIMVSIETEEEEEEVVITEEDEVAEEHTETISISPGSLVSDATKLDTFQQIVQIDYSNFKKHMKLKMRKMIRRRQISYSCTKWFT